MAKKWYPVIDILTCVECGTCVEFCPHGVYDMKIVMGTAILLIGLYMFWLAF